MAESREPRAPRERAGFARWPQDDGQAWEQGDPDAIVRLCTESAAEYEQPFPALLAGHVAIHGHSCDGARDGQSGVRFCASVLAVSEATGLAHRRASFVRPANRTRVELDGVLTGRVADDGRCAGFREFRHRRETAPAP